jgi:Carbohydrate esterase, sialic acid-specific acetylesterase
MRDNDAMNPCEARTMKPSVRKHIVPIVALLALAGLAPELALAEEVTRVFLFAGQSNMVGSDAHADRIDDFPEYRGAGIPQDDVLYSYLLGNGDEASQGWQALQPGHSFGPELTFARRVKTHVRAPIAIIKSAVGGTTVAYDWNPDAPDKGQKLYPRTLRLIRDSLRELEKRGIRYRLEGVMWHQGENDMLDRELGKQYAAGLAKLISQLRKDLEAPELKWYIAEISEKGIWGMDHRSQLGVLHQQQHELLKADPLLRWVPTSHLAFEVMGSGQPHYHFGTQGQLQMGEAFADAYLQEMGRPRHSTERRFQNELPSARSGRVKLFVLAGQRNMEGEDSHVSEIADTAGFEPLVKNQEQVLYRYSLGGGAKVSADWEPLGPLDYLGSFGPELSLGARLRQSIDANEGLAIVKFTHSGAQGPDWLPQGSPEAHRNLYPKFIAFIRKAQDDLNRRGLECHLEAVFWHVGENDTYFGPYRQNQARWLQQLIEQVRLDLKQPDLPWFISEQHQQAPWGNIDAVNASLHELAKSVPQVTIVKTSQLPHAKHHFGTRGTLALGQELAEEFLRKP